MVLLREDTELAVLIHRGTWLDVAVITLNHLVTESWTWITVKFAPRVKDSTPHVPLPGSYLESTLERVSFEKWLVCVYLCLCAHALLHACIQILCQAPCHF